MFCFVVVGDAARIGISSSCISEGGAFFSLMRIKGTSPTFKPFISYKYLIKRLQRRRVKPVLLAFLHSCFCCLVNARPILHTSLAKGQYIQSISIIRIATLDNPETVAYGCKLATLRASCLAVVTDVMRVIGVGKVIELLNHIMLVA